MSLFPDPQASLGFPVPLSERYRPRLHLVRTLDSSSIQGLSLVAVPAKRLETFGVSKFYESAIESKPSHSPTRKSKVYSWIFRSHDFRVVESQESNVALAAARTLSPVVSKDLGAQFYGFLPLPFVVIDQPPCVILPLPFFEMFCLFLLASRTTPHTWASRVSALITDTLLLSFSASFVLCLLFLSFRKIKSSHGNYDTMRSREGN